MKFEKRLYKKTYFIKAIKEVEKDFWITVDWKETQDGFEIKNTDNAIKIADYYIYIYNEKN